MDAEKGKLIELRRKVREMQGNLKALEQSLRWFEEDERFEKTHSPGSYYELAQALFRVLRRDVDGAVKAIELKVIPPWSEEASGVD